MDEIYSPSPAASFFSLPLFVAVVEVEMCICDGVGTLAFFLECCPFESGAMLMKKKKGLILRIVMCCGTIGSLH